MVTHFLAAALALCQAQGAGLPAVSRPRPAPLPLARYLGVSQEELDDLHRLCCAAHEAPGRTLRIGSPARASALTVAALPAPARPTLEQLASLLKTHCAQCHSGAAGAGLVSLFDDRGRFDPNVPLSVVRASVRAERTPPCAVKWSSAEKALVEAFDPHAHGDGR